MIFTKFKYWAAILAVVPAALVVNGCRPTQNADTPLAETTQPETLGQEEAIAPDVPTNTPPSVEADTQNTVQRTEATDPNAPSELAGSPASGAPVQTQFGPDQSEVDLLSAKVNGDILTVTLRYRANASQRVSNIYPIEEVSYIDDATSKQYGVVQNQEGEWLAAPKGKSVYAESINVNAQSNQEEIVWFKFPAPPAETKTISITLPEVSPFDGVPVARRG